MSVRPKLFLRHIKKVNVTSYNLIVFLYFIYYQSNQRSVQQNQLVSVNITSVE